MRGEEAGKGGLPLRCLGPTKDATPLKKRPSPREPNKIKHPNPFRTRRPFILQLRVRRRATGRGGKEEGLYKKGSPLAEPVNPVLNRLSEAPSDVLLVPMRRDTQTKDSITQNTPRRNNNQHFFFLPSHPFFRDTCNINYQPVNLTPRSDM